MNKFLKFFFGRLNKPGTLEETASNPNCTNCGAALNGPFCSNCGQKKEHKHDFTIWHFLGHSLHEFTHLDSRFLRSFKYLVTRPGFLTEEYIAGHRKKYINPIRLFILANILYFIFVSFAHSNTFTTPLKIQIDDRYRNITKPMVIREIHRLGINYKEYEEAFDHNIKEHAKTLIIIMVPMFSLVLSLLYFRQKRYFIEHLAFGLYYFSILLILLSIGIESLFLLLNLLFFLSLKFNHSLAIIFQNILSSLDSDNNLTIILGIALFVVLFISLKKVYKESVFSTFIKAIVGVYCILPIIGIYRLILFFITFYTLHFPGQQQEKHHYYSQNWVQQLIKQSSSTPWISFEWTGYAPDKYFSKTGMNVPLKIENLPHNFNMLFDLDFKNTFLFENSFKNYITQYGILKDKLAQDKYFLTNNGPIKILNGLSLAIDSQNFKADHVIIMSDYGDAIPKDSIFSQTPKNVGVIGTDICNNKVLIIDYPNKRFCLLDSVPSEYTCKFSDFTTDIRNLVYVDMYFRGKKYKVQFDNSSNIPSLYVFNDMISKFSTEPVTDTLLIPTNRGLIQHTKRPMNGFVTIAGQTFSNIDVYTSLKQGQENIPIDCDAKIGNAIFMNNIVVIDFKNKKFGIK